MTDFSYKKGGKNAKFYFKDIDEIGIPEIDAKHKISVSNIKFKKSRLAYGLMQPIGDDNAVIYDKYELSKHEVFKILKQKFEALNAQKSENKKKSNLARPADVKFDFWLLRPKICEFDRKLSQTCKAKFIC